MNLGGSFLMGSTDSISRQLDSRDWRLATPNFHGRFHGQFAMIGWDFCLLLDLLWIVAKSSTSSQMHYLQCFIGIFHSYPAWCRISQPSTDAQRCDQLRTASHLLDVVAFIRGCQKDWVATRKKTSGTTWGLPNMESKGIWWVGESSSKFQKTFSDYLGIRSFAQKHGSL